MHLPEAFLERMRNLFSDEEEWKQFLQSFSEEPKRGIRVNTQKLREAEKHGFSFSDWKKDWNLIPLFSFHYSDCEEEKGERVFVEDIQNNVPEDLQENSSEILEKTEVREFLVDESYLASQGITIGRDPYHEAGLYYIQDPSAMEVVPHMEIRPFDRCLDLCAAPGGKSMQIADRLDRKRGGFLLSNEYVGERARILSKNAERMGYANLSVVNESPAHLAALYPGFFSRILVDAPCSGEGMFRKSKEAVEDWSEELVEKCALRQKEILREAFTMLREGGILAYSTCTFERTENEDIREWIERENPAYRLLMEKRLYFHNSSGEGQYFAVFKKSGEEPAEEERELSYTVFQKNKMIFCYASQLRPFSELKLFRQGISIYEEGKKEWEYSHGLSHAVDLKDIFSIEEQRRPKTKYSLLYSLFLKRTDRRVEDYLLGNEIGVEEKEIEGIEGIEGIGELIEGKEHKAGMSILYCDGLPLGFGYLRNGRLRNFYPKGLRYKK